MPGTPVQSEATLQSQQSALLKLADEYGEKGNQAVIAASWWVRPVLADFIALVRARRLGITNSQSLDSYQMKTADRCMDAAIDLIVSAYPLTARGHVRSITSKIRNDLAIVRLDATDSSYPNEITVTDPASDLKKITPEQFKLACHCSESAREEVSDIMLDAALFAKFAPQVVAKRSRVTTSRIARLSDVAHKQYTEGDAELQTLEKYETYFDAFRNYWIALPYGNLYLAFAIKQLIHNSDLLKKIVRYRVDINELILSCLPTIEMRKIAFQHILEANYLSSHRVSGLFEKLPEGKDDHWRMNMAEYGIKKYRALLKNKYPDLWEKSAQKIRADIYSKLLAEQPMDASFAKKIIVYAAFQSNSKNLPKFICKAMGYHHPVIVTQKLWESLQQEAAVLKIDFAAVTAQIIEPLILNVAAEKKLESGAYAELMIKLSRVVPRLDVMKSSLQSR